MATKLQSLVVGVFVLPLLTFGVGSSGTQPLDVLHVPADFTAADVARSTEDAFQEALSEELPGLKKMQLLATKPTATVHKSSYAPPKVTSNEAFPPSDESTSPKDTSNEAAPPSDEPVSDFEKDVTDLVLGLSKQGLGATPMGGSVQKIKDVIEKDMMVKVKAAHVANQKELDRLAARVAQCTTTKDDAYAKAKKWEKAYLLRSTQHKVCRQAEAGLYIDNLAAWKELKEKKKIKDVLCKQYSITSRKVGEQNQNKQIVSKGGSEGVETYVRRISRTICGRPGTRGVGGHEKNGFLDVLLIAKDKCEKATKAYNKQLHLCKKLDKQWHDTRSRCNNIQDDMDNAACKFATGAKDACESYAECYKDRVQAYETAEKTVRGEEIDRKAEWKGLERMKCIIVAFSDGKVEAAEITACKNKNHSTDYFNITYPNIPPMQKCIVPDLYPVTAAYKAREFAPLPIQAKGKVDANLCNSVQSISTVPNSGSPASCKCERVTMNGPFSPGGMVKCTNCIDARRSKDRNSCPIGTKLFSPTSRLDWDTFLKSADPLRAPNWIVDVTRPQNGCGGCTRYHMHSGVTQQSTWRTVDGTPWWLRSTKYNEPNGDYHANCYLDLWHNPKSADSVTWNDLRCSYHSKAYYCQSVKITLKPKPGSPAGCKCTKVEIAQGRTYSQTLLKCSKCLEVRRATEKNSCPLGTKLFAPASRADWHAFIASATSLRDPHWIIDVTRPQNGCGGCTRSPMHSKVAAQATWGTADKAPWWLRSTRYNEPNGDYTANCYLDLWQKPANENSVTFNDGRCNYRSKSYYCQSVKPKNFVPPTTPPPWKRVISTVPNAGSPATCKCTELKLIGSYAAGGIVKCESCSKVYKTTQRNSCPSGTKLFSPASREDWKTFLKSGGKPLRAPHWIIDVTRPQNGCGGCTRNAMNSGNQAQATWKTADNSPWWLRSRTYNEPNGDYHANCYLDLWRTPANEDSVTWNDGSCSYHSKSYYCQLKAE